MATNVFDQFDQGNVFDQFDTVAPPAPPQKERYMDAFLRGARETPDALYALASGITGGTAGGLAGLGARAVRGVTGIETNPKQVRESVANLFTHQPSTQTGKDVMRVAGIPGEYISKGAQAIENAATKVNPRLGKATGETLGTVGDLLAAAPLAGKQIMATIPERPVKPYVTPPPSQSTLKSAAKDAYQQVKEAGVTLKPEGYGEFADSLRPILKEEGFNETLTPGSASVLREIEALKGQPISFQELENLRRQALAAEGSQLPADRRMAAIIIDKIDDYADKLESGDALTGNVTHATDAIKEARNLYSRNKKSVEITSLIERAKTRSSQFSGSGFENALRTEFRQVSMNPKRLRRFTSEEQAAIKAVAEGNLSSNVLRQIGKLAPTGGLSQWLAIGGTLINPLAAAIPAIGGAARIGATRMTNKAALAADELMRRGPISKETANMNFQNMALPEPLNLTLADGPMLPTRQPAALSEFDTGGLGFADDMSLPAPTRQRMTMDEISKMAGGLELEKPRLALPFREMKKNPMVIDPQGRVAISREQLRDYLKETGQEGLRNVRQPSIETRKLFPLSKKESLEIEAKNLGLFESDSPSLEMRKLEADWMRRYKDATKEK